MLSTVSAIGGHVLKKPQQRKHDGQHYKAQFATSDYFSKESESSTSFTSKLEIQPNNNQSQLMTMTRKARNIENEIQKKPSAVKAENFETKAKHHCTPETKQLSFSSKGEEVRNLFITELLD